MAKKATSTATENTSTATETKAPKAPVLSAEQQCQHIFAELQAALRGAKLELVLNNGKSHLLRDGAQVNKNMNAACLRNFLYGYLEGVKG